MAIQTDDELAEEQNRADEVYDRVVSPVLRPEDARKYLAVAFETGDFEIDADNYTATERILSRRLGARVWLMRTNRTAAYLMR